jgi:hypothetical protein
MTLTTIKSGPLAPGQSDLDRHSAEGRRGRPHVILVVGSTELGPRALYSASWLGRRLGAEMLVVAAVEYSPPHDELVDALMEAAGRAVSATTTHLVRESVPARGIVVAVPNSQAPAAIDNLADQHETELVAVISRRRSWFRVFPGSPIGHRLTRTGHRPVLVIPDHRAGLGAWIRAWLDGTRGGN